MNQEKILKFKYDFDLERVCGTTKESLGFIF